MNKFKLKEPYYVVPGILFNDNDKESIIKKLLCIIISLTLNKGYCFVSMEYFAKKLKVSKLTIDILLATLVERDWIYVKCEDGKKKIYLCKDKELLVYNN